MGKRAHIYLYSVEITNSRYGILAAKLSSPSVVELFLGGSQLIKQLAL